VPATVTRFPDPEPPPAPLPAEFERFYAEQAPKLFRAAHRITGSAVDAEDVVQTVFLRLLGRSDVVLGAGSEGYLYRSALNAALDVVRARQRSGWVPLEDPESGVGWPADPGPGPDREHERRRLRRSLRLALSRLAPRAAETFALRYFEGLGNAEIAELLGTSSGVVAVLLHRTRARLRKELGLLLGEPT
jgi:RNA polymerase sigma-70 factor (ECF subfamily)